MNSSTRIPADSFSSSDPPSTHAHTDISQAELLARFFRVLGDPTRVRLLHLLLEAPASECTVGELVAALALAATLADLAGHDLIQRDVATGRIRAAYPFSGVPTPHRVTLSRKAAGSPHERADQHKRAEQQVFAMCALDALGIPLLLRQQ